MVVVGKQVGNFTSQIQLVKKELFTHTYTHIRIRKKKRKIGLAVAVWLFFGCLHFVFAKTQQKAYKYVKNI